VVKGSPASVVIAALVPPYSCLPHVQDISVCAQVYQGARAAGQLIAQRCASLQHRQATLRLHAPSNVLEAGCSWVKAA
jgi:hypothetical protein